VLILSSSHSQGAHAPHSNAKKVYEALAISFPPSPRVNMVRLRFPRWWSTFSLSPPHYDFANFLIPFDAEDLGSGAAPSIVFPSAVGSLFLFAAAAFPPPSSIAGC